KRKATKRKTKARAKTRSKASKSKVLKLPKAPKTETITLTETSPRNTVNVGDMAPEFTTVNQNGETVSLSQFRGRKVVLYFYPKDDTPGCTKEACSFRDHLTQFKDLDAEIIGISFDDQQSH